ncbi:hypothetical protein [Streptomyces longwoodensis]|uniref:hypothetical protein n=1 Tax=Streptomyces longwoodensis TaxID=68231 RepID=UPI003814E3AC
MGAALALGLAGAVTVPATGHAAPVDISCPMGSRHTTYTPPLTNTVKPEHLVLTEHFSCVSLLGGVSSGDATSSVDVSTSCVISVQSPLTLPARTFTIGWNTGESSTVTYPATTAVRAADGTVTITSVGAVTDGLGEGQVATQVTVEPNLDVTACATTGLSATNSLTNTLVIAPA